MATKHSQVVKLKPVPIVDEILVAALLARERVRVIADCNPACLMSQQVSISTRATDNAQHEQKGQCSIFMTSAASTVWILKHSHHSVTT